jgi:putative DNA primase/helicase
LRNELRNPRISAYQPAEAKVLDCSGDIIPDGQLHRFKANGDRNPNSFYVLHADGIPAGSFGCFKRGIQETWCAKGSAELTAEERAERDRTWKQQQQEREADRRRQHDEAGTQAAAILNAAQPATDDHPYLLRKAVKAALGLMVGPWPQRQQDHCLWIPLRTAAGQLATVQAISASTFRFKDGIERDKDFLKGGAKQGAYFVIGDLNAGAVILLAEGYASAATDHEATGYPTVMGIDAGNLPQVA